MEFLTSSSLIFALVFNDLIIMHGLFRCSLEASDMEFQELLYAIRNLIITVR